MNVRYITIVLIVINLLILNYIFIKHILFFKDSKKFDSLIEKINKLRK